MFNRTEIAVSNVLRVATPKTNILEAKLQNAMIGKKRGQFKRHNALLITNLDNGAWTIRYASGASGIKGVNRTTIGLDYDCISELGIQVGTPVNLHVRKASLLKSLNWLLNSSDLNVRLNTRFALIGLVLGILSFFPLFR